MSAIKSIKKNKLLLTVAAVYIILFFSAPAKAGESVKNSMYYVIEMLEIMPVIFILTSLIEAWVPKEVIMNGFGEKSGLKGAALSFLLGSFSAGPIYAAFPVCKMLIKKGASIPNIVIILSAWAVIKVPMLANEAKFLGPGFMAIRWGLTTVSIFIMAYLVSLFVKKADIPADAESKLSPGKIPEIKGQYCVGCGLCTKLFPEYFKMTEGKASVIRKDVPHDIVESISNKCPSKAIY